MLKKIGMSALGLIAVLAYWTITGDHGIIIPATNVAGERDCLNQLPGLARIYDDALLGFLYSPGGNIVANPILSGCIGMGWG